jgi:hypothetical protein
MYFALYLLYKLFLAESYGWRGIMPFLVGDSTVLLYTFHICAALLWPREAYDDYFTDTKNYGIN